MLSQKNETNQQNQQGQEPFPFKDYEMKYLRGLQIIGSKSDIMQAMAYEGLPLNQKEELRIAKLNQKKTATARQKNPYDVNEMIKNDPSIPVIVGGGGYANGPEYRDPRLNLEYTLFVKNKIDGEKFWVKYVSGSSESNANLTEVRWDLFEDAMLAYL